MCKRTLIIMVCGVLALSLAPAGCDTFDETEDDAVNGGMSPVAGMPPVEGRYQGPRMQVGVDQDGERSVADITARVPTGGWALQVDEGAVRDDTAHVYLTLVRPGPDEMVTQALETVTTEWSSVQRFDDVRVYARTVRRGVGEAPEAYALAAEE